MNFKSKSLKEKNKILYSCSVSAIALRSGRILTTDKASKIAAIHPRIIKKYI